jgi:CRP/FNR family transcriptional regulator, nitrogen oxide reductase regulator
MVAEYELGHTASDSSWGGRSGARRNRGTGRRDQRHETLRCPGFCKCDLMPAAHGATIVMKRVATVAVQEVAEPTIFASIPEHDRRLILRHAELRTALAREVIIKGGDPASTLILLCEGRAKYCRLTEQGEEILLRWVTAGDVFGLATLLPNPPAYIGSAEALTDCKLLVWQHSAILRLAHNYPTLSTNALRITLEYLAAYSDRHTRIVTQSAKQRLAHTLVRVAHQAGRVAASGIDVDITNEQLGGLADTGVFTTIRQLSDWERQGAVTKQRGRIRIHAPELLLAR